MTALRQPTRTALLIWAVGGAALFSGAALLAHILAGIAMPLALGVTATLLVATLIVVARRASSAQRRLLLDRALVGLVTGVLATAAYDGAKFVLSQWDPSPYNPFEALRVFGVILLGASAPAAAVQAAGLAFHLLNGLAFGVAYCYLAGRRGILMGVAWGVFLEIFQLTLYPGWLDVRFYQEFVQISGLSHLVYGMVLGLGCQVGLRRIEARRRRALDSR
jgi:hypothetical protein